MITSIFSAPCRVVTVGALSFPSARIDRSIAEGAEKPKTDKKTYPFDFGGLAMTSPMAVYFSFIIGVTDI